MPRAALALAQPTEEYPAPATERDVIRAAALHAAAAALPGTDLKARDHLRETYATALRVVWLRHDPDFALACLPGVSAADATAFAVHLATGTVFDPDPRLSTREWLAGLRAALA